MVLYNKNDMIENTMKDWDTLNLFLYGPPHS